MKLSIVIPCYNEEKNIPLILKGFGEVIRRNDIEVIIVNNGSTDNSEYILNDLLPRYPFVRSIEVKINQGYGFGILVGLKEARGEYIGWTHGDMQTSPKDVLMALKIIEDKGSPQKIYIKGERRERPLFDRFFTLGMSIFESLYLGKFLYDINAQPNIFHRSFFETWVNPPYDFALDLYVFYSVKKLNIPVVRFPVVFSKRIYGESHWNKNLLSKWKFIKRTVIYSINLKKNL
jgi:glycosyltransferase involved in cell wall biosynthesis